MLRSVANDCSAAREDAACAVAEAEARRPLQKPVFRSPTRRGRDRADRRRLGSRADAVGGIGPGRARRARTKVTPARCVRARGKAADRVARKRTRLFTSMPQAAAADITGDNGPSRTIIDCTAWASKTLFVTLCTWRKATWRTPSVGCGASCRARQTSHRCRTEACSLLRRAYNNTPRKCLDFKTAAEPSQSVALEAGSAHPRHSAGTNG